MRKAILALAVVILTAGPALADISFTYGGNPYTAVAQVQVSNAAWHGGAFTVTVVSGSLGVPSGFKTFCVESQITFNPGVTYYASIDTAAVTGGTGTTDPLGGKAADIYSDYLAGALGAYSDQQISEAIWFQENEVGGVDNAVSQAAVDNGIGNVRVLNLWTLSYNPASDTWTAIDVQSHLVKIPAPAAIGLGALGLGLVGWLMRRIA